MRALILSLGITILFACSGKPGKKEDPAQVKIAAYNVEFSKRATAAEIGKALKPYNFDVVCFSEAPGGGWTKEVGDAMGLQYIAVGKYSTAGHDDKYKSIVSRTPLSDFEEVLMADTLHTATKAFTIIDNTPIAVYAVHFPFGWRDQAHIDETTNKIATFVEYLKKRQNDEISVIAGDFNFIPSNADSTSMYYEMFVEIEMDVTWKDLGIDCTKHNTWNAFEAEHTGNGEVIDHIIFNTAKMDVLEGEIIEIEIPLSDHKPVWALLQVKKN